MLVEMFKFNLVSFYSFYGKRIGFRVRKLFKIIHQGNKDDKIEEKNEGVFENGHY